MESFQLPSAKYRLPSIIRAENLTLQQQQKELANNSRATELISLSQESKAHSDAQEQTSNKDTPRLHTSECMLYSSPLIRSGCNTHFNTSDSKCNTFAEKSVYRKQQIHFNISTFKSLDHKINLSWIIVALLAACAMLI